MLSGPNSTLPETAQQRWTSAPHSNERAPPYSNGRAPPHSDRPGALKTDERLLTGTDRAASQQRTNTTHKDGPGVLTTTGGRPLTATDQTHSHTNGRAPPHKDGPVALTQMDGRPHSDGRASPYRSGQSSSQRDGRRLPQPRSRVRDGQPSAAAERDGRPSFTATWHGRSPPRQRPWGEGWSPLSHGFGGGKDIYSAAANGDPSNTATADAVII